MTPTIDAEALREILEKAERLAWRNLGRPPLDEVHFRRLIAERVLRRLHEAEGRG